MSVFVRMFRGHTLCLHVDFCCNSGENIKGKISELEGIPASFLSLYHHGWKVCSDDVIVPGESYQALLCLDGGKGGFGSMLRMIGAQIDKTTNHDACRDLSGRRMRDVNNEKKLSEWIGKKAEMEQERIQKREEKLERLRHQPRHIFVDPKYDQQKKEVIDNLDDAITQGIHAAATVNPGASTSGAKVVKRKAETSESNKRSNILWMGVEGSDSEDSENDEGPMETKTTAFAPKTDTSNESSPSSGHSSNRDSPSSTTDQEAQPELESQPNSTDGNAPEIRPESLDTKKSDEEPTEGNNSLLTALPLPTQSGGDIGSDCSKASTIVTSGPLDLDQFSSVAELEALGLDTLKSALVALGMKCGGTLQQRTERLFSVKGVKPDLIDPSLLAKQSKGKKAKGK